MFLRVGSLLLFSSTLIIASLPQEINPPPNEDDPFPCDTRQFTNLDKCCRTPQFFPPDTLIGCIEEMGTVDPKEELKDFQEFAGMEAVNFFSGAAGPMIIIDCMFKNHNLLVPTGEMDMDKIQKVFVDVSSSAWRPVVKTAVEVCTFDLTNLNKSAVVESELANINPAFFMSCLRRFLSLNCPDSIKNKTDSGCEVTMTEVSHCHPFSVVTGNEGGPRGWIGSLLRWLAGPQGQKNKKSKSIFQYLFFPFSN